MHQDCIIGGPGAPLPHCLHPVDCFLKLVMSIDCSAQGSLTKYIPVSVCPGVSIVGGGKGFTSTEGFIPAVPKRLPWYESAVTIHEGAGEHVLPVTSLVDCLGVDVACRRGTATSTRRTPPTSLRCCSST